jgi:hypothetical protein
MEIKIEKGIPIPKKRESKWSLFGQMNVGDSVFFPFTDESSSTSCTSSMTYYSTKKGYKLTRRITIENGVRGIRVWRLM